MLFLRTITWITEMWVEYLTQRFTCTSLSLAWPTAQCVMSVWWGGPTGSHSRNALPLALFLFAVPTSMEFYLYALTVFSDSPSLLLCTIHFPCTCTCMIVHEHFTVAILTVTCCSVITTYGAIIAHNSTVNREGLSQKIWLVEPHTDFHVQVLYYMSEPNRPE